LTATEADQRPTAGSGFKRDFHEIIGAVAALADAFASLGPDSQLNRTLASLAPTLNAATRLTGPNSQITRTAASLAATSDAWKTGFGPNGQITKAIASIAATLNTSALLSDLDVVEHVTPAEIADAESDGSAAVLPVGTALVFALMLLLLAIMAEIELATPDVSERINRIFSLPLAILAIILASPCTAAVLRDLTRRWWLPVAG